ncbi:MAG TPA: glucoamylase family protein [Sphingomonas sp.]|uniref:glucoamylase family protein n=1 Tax=Sphingomonas sp. TaxID=28214 RepID=UPI002ED91657
MPSLSRRGVLLGSAGLLAGCAPLRLVAPPSPVPPTAALLGDLKERTFRYFWDTTDPATGLAPDRWPTPSFASIAAVGFALTAYPIGVVNRWITRAAARDRTLATLRFFDRANKGPQEADTTGHMGFFYHFIDRTAGYRLGLTELSTVDTALLLGGILFAQSWFDDEDDPQEAEIRRLAEAIYVRVDWTWAVQRPPFVSMGWRPETGFIQSDWNIYNEGMLLYILAIASPTYPLPRETWNAWTRTFDASWIGESANGYTTFPPLFGHQYSQVWLDLKGLRDDYSRRRGFDYFENSRRATYAQRAWAVANRGGFKDYGPDIWGLTACDGPGDFTTTVDGVRRTFFSYSARGPGDRDDGTIAPTAAGGSIAFAPEIVIPALNAMRDRYGAVLYGQYGFFDSFNPTLTASDQPLLHGRIHPGIGWVDGDHLGIDQGPILAMAENHDTGLVWQTMRRNPHIRRGLKLAGFTGGWLDVAE